MDTRLHMYLLNVNEDDIAIELVSCVPLQVIRYTYIKRNNRPGNEWLALSIASNKGTVDLECKT